MTESSGHPYDSLTPDAVIDAVESLGYLSDARLLALNSYENRVYQVGLEEAEPVILKFYRPARWSLEQIQEEHEFIRELAEADISVVAPFTAACGEQLDSPSTYSPWVHMTRARRTSRMRAAKACTVTGSFCSQFFPAAAGIPRNWTIPTTCWCSAEPWDGSTRLAAPAPSATGSVSPPRGWR